MIYHLKAAIAECSASCFSKILNMVNSKRAIVYFCIRWFPLSLQAIAMVYSNLILYALKVDWRLLIPSFFPSVIATMFQRIKSNRCSTIEVSGVEE